MCGHFEVISLRIVHEVWVANLMTVVPLKYMYIYIYWYLPEVHGGICSNIFFGGWESLSLTIDSRH